MTVSELLGIALAIGGLAFAFETPRKWFLRGLRLNRSEPRVASEKIQDIQLEKRADQPADDRFESAPDSQTSSISASEIIDAINGAPPFQRDSVDAHYAGVNINSVGFLRNVEQDPRDNSLVMVNLITDKSKIVSYSIWFSIHPDKVPEIKTLQRDSTIRVSGTIQSASGPGLYVRINPDSIVVLERATQTT